MFSSVTLSFPPDDRTRVKLWPYTGVIGSDYINASFVDVSDCKVVGSPKANGATLGSRGPNDSGVLKQISN